MQPSVRPSAAQIDHDREQGWLAPGRVLDDAETAALRAEEERFRLPIAYGGAGNQTLFVNVELCHRSEPIRRFCTAGAQLEAVRALLGPAVRLTHPRDTEQRNGGGVVLPGSHRPGLLPHDAAGVNPLLRETRAAIAPVPVPLAAGEAVAFTGLTLHGSGPNRSGAPRPGLFVRDCEPHAVMVSEGGRPVLEDPHSWMVAGEARSAPRR